MNPKEITGHLVSLGYEATLSSDNKEVEVSCIVSGQKASLLHRFPAELTGAPKFELIGAARFGTLAHVVPNEETGLGKICVADADSISVNTDCPPLAYAASLERHIELINKLLMNPEWNREELLREFHSNWDLLCQKAGTSLEQLYFVAEGTSANSVEIKQPSENYRLGLRGNLFGMATSLISDRKWEQAREFARWAFRTVVGKSVHLHLETLDPAPRALSELFEWYDAAMDQLDDSSHRVLERLRKQPGKMYWVVLSANIPDGTTWFAIRFKSPSKRKLPTSKTEAELWRIAPYRVCSLSQNSLVPRGGGLTELARCSVLLVGCGSVGSELAYKLVAAGIGNLTVSDPDFFMEANLYRHTLSIADLGQRKSTAVAESLRLRFPWANVVDWDKRLEDLRDVEELRAFDLIVVAIGSPNIERIFHDYCRTEQVRCPILSCWVEAYGVGGHAILDLPESKGCWRCVYVDPETGEPGLASNLNFLAPNQDLEKSHEGCGYQFLPFSAIDAGYTGSMAADLAVRYLRGVIDVSSMMSWRGSGDKAIEENFELTYRYRNFAESLTVHTLFNGECHVCGD